MSIESEVDTIKLLCTDDGDGELVLLLLFGIDDSLSIVCCC